MKLNVSADKLQQLAALMERVGLKEDDLTERFVRASGPGGQKVNKTSSAVYLRHGPSGMEVKVQAARSQSLNRFNARRLLALKMEREQLGKASLEEARISKIKRQKRKRSRRAKNRMLDDKRAHSDKKQSRRVRHDD